MTEALASRRPPPPVPVSIVTGFLGAGKTSLLNMLLRDRALQGAVVLINEFGEIGLDHLFMEKIDGDMVMMASGCLCCTIRGDLVDALEDLLRRRDNGRIRDFDRVIIETTGLADPAPVLHTIMSHPYLALRFRLDGVIAVIDAVNGAATLDNHVEAVKQAAVADRLVVAKTDLLSQSDRLNGALVARLKKLNPTARLFDLADRPITAADLLDAGLYNPDAKDPQVRRWLNAESLDGSDGDDRGPHHDHHGHRGHEHDVNRHDGSIRAYCLTSEDRLPASACELFLELLRSAHGPHLLRVKGVIALAEDPERPLVVHGVQHVFHPPVRLPAWPDEDRRTRMVFILKDMDPVFVERLYAAFAGRPAPDAPDAKALTENPLQIRPRGLLS